MGANHRRAALSRVDGRDDAGSVPVGVDIHPALA